MTIVDSANFEGQAADFTNADLVAVDFSNADLRKANFTNATMRGAHLARARATEANFQGACLVNAIFGVGSSSSGGGFTPPSGARLRGANFRNADLTGAKLHYADISWADLSTAILKDIDWTSTMFNQETKFPADFQIPPELLWCGSTVDPRIAQEIARLLLKGPIEFTTFVDSLKRNLDAERLKRAFKMLKAEKLQLFAETTDNAVSGVVKSQNDPTLVYSCRLNSDGTYFCCTQNLKPCGGLKGDICKHLIVLLVGLTKDGQLDATRAISWVGASLRRARVVLDKDIASETFLRYKGAEAGEIDWRPTETLPEDYYAI